MLRDTVIGKAQTTARTMKGLKHAHVHACC